MELIRLQVILFVFLLALGCKRPAIQGDEAKIKVSSGSFNFKEIVESTESIRKLQVKNEGDSSASKLNLTVDDNSFEILSSSESLGDACDKKLGPGGTCNIYLRFSPLSVLNISSQVVLTYESGDGVKKLSIPILAESMPTPSASINYLEGVSFDFANLSLGSVSEQTITLENNGTADATSLNGTSISPPFRFKGGIFPGSGGTCGATLVANGGTCTLVLEFSPTISGSYSQNLNVQYNNGISPTFDTILLEGVGDAPPEAFLGFSEGFEFDFEDVDLNETISQTLTIVNSGNANATGFSVIGLGAPFGFLGGVFPGTGGDCGTTISSGGGSCSIEIEFLPIVALSYSQNLIIQYHNGVGVQNFIFAVKGIGTPPDPASLSVLEGDTHDFGDVDVDDSATQLLTIVNSGELDATSVFLQSITFPFRFEGGTYPGSSGTCGSVIAKNGGSCLISLEFSPDVGGEVSGNLNVHYNNGYISDFLELAIEARGVPYGQPDPTFDGDGITILDFANLETVKSVQILSDGKILAIGEEKDGAGGSDISLVQLESSGSPDTSFGLDSNGRVSTDFELGEDSLVDSATVQADGKVVICGSSDSEMAIARFTTSGTLDSGFGFGGKIFIDLLPLIANIDKVHGIKALPTGEIVAVGESTPLLGDSRSFVLRLLPSGLLDALFFGLSGVLLFDFDSSKDDGISDLAIDSTGRIVVAGYTFDGDEYDSAVARVLSTGNLDLLGFGSSGKTVVDGSGQGLNDKFHSVALQSDDKAIVVGYRDNGDNKDIYAARFNTDGTMDSTFNSQGWISIDVAGYDDEGLNIAIDSLDRILISGYSSNGSDEDTVLVRLNSDGSRDSKFGVAGVVVQPFESSSERSEAIAIQSDDHIVLGGYSATSSEKDYLVLRYTP